MAKKCAEEWTKSSFNSLSTLSARVRFASQKQSWENLTILVHNNDKSDNKRDRNKGNKFNIITIWIYEILLCSNSYNTAGTFP